MTPHRDTSSANIRKSVHMSALPSTLSPTFDFFSDTPLGKDPDEHSPTLRQFHSVLWSKPLRSGRELAPKPPTRRGDGYLIHEEEGLKLWFGSDAITHSYGTWLKPRALVDAVAALDESQRAKYLNQPYTVAETMIWPVRSQDLPTLNQARGTRSVIDDRFDLTLECIRRHYQADGDSPLADVLTAYGDVFALFEDFNEFVDFFHFQDLVSPDYGSVRFFLPFEQFERNGAPRTVDEYITYREAQLAFVQGRQHRIAQWLESNR